MRFFFFTLIYLFLVSPLSSQVLTNGEQVFCADSASIPFFDIPNEIKRKRLNSVIIGGGVSYAIAGFSLYQFWYRDQELTTFHFFNDGRDWKGMDKAGHAYSAYFQSELYYGLYRWTGMQDRKAVWFGAGTSLLFLTTIEVMDGFAEKWGFSWYDMGSNVLGAAGFVAQQLIWEEQKFRLKWSYSPVRHSADPIYSHNGGVVSSLNKRADQLFGGSFAERMIKDYNGHRYWISFDPRVFSGKEKGRMDWLNVAIGLGSSGLYGGRNNEWETEGHSFYPDIPRKYRFFLAPDVDWSKIETHSPWLRMLFRGLNWLKIPSPAIELDSHGNWSFHWMLF